MIKIDEKKIISFLNAGSIADLRAYVGESH